MEHLMEFLNIYGWQLALIALGGIVLLGILKYANVFSKIEKENRKPIYLVFSVGFSCIAAIIYLAIIDQLTIEFLATFAFAIYGLNQTFYAIYETTTLRDLVSNILQWLGEKVKNK